MSGLYWIGAWAGFGWATGNAWYYGPNRTWAWTFRAAEYAYGQFQPILARFFGITPVYTVDLTWERETFGHLALVAVAVVGLTGWVMLHAARKRRHERRDFAAEVGAAQRRRR